MLEYKRYSVLCEEGESGNIPLPYSSDFGDVDQEDPGCFAERQQSDLKQQERRGD